MEIVIKRGDQAIIDVDVDTGALARVLEGLDRR